MYTRVHVLVIKMTEEHPILLEKYLEETADNKIICRTLFGFEETGAIEKYVAANYTNSISDIWRAITKL